MFCTICFVVKVYKNNNGPRLEPCGIDNERILEETLSISIYFDYDLCRCL